MRLLVLRSAWGLRGLRDAPARTLAGLRSAGFDGLEASLEDLGASAEARAEAVRAARDEGLSLIISAYSSWANYEGPATEQLLSAPSGASPPAAAAASIPAPRLFRHAVRPPRPADARTRGDCRGERRRRAPLAGAASQRALWVRRLERGRGCRLSRLVVEAASRVEALPPVSHETHRGRALCCPFATARLLRRVPQLRLTSDLSHWVVKTERMLDTAPEQELLLRQVAPAVDHLHARVGTPQAPQVVSLAESATTARAAERFYGWWEACWAAAEARSLSSRDSTLTATVEYGPAELGEDGQVLAGSYSPLDLHGRARERGRPRRHARGRGRGAAEPLRAVGSRQCRPAPCACSEPFTPAATPAAGGTRTRRAGWRCWRDHVWYSGAVRAINPTFYAQKPPRRPRQVKPPCGRYV